MKHLNIIILLLILLLTGCFTTVFGFFKTGFRLVKDEVSPDYIQETYYTNNFFCNEYTENNLNSIKLDGRKHIIENTEITQKEKKELVNKLKGLKYEDNKFFYFQIISKHPFLNDDLKFNFDIIDKSNNSYLLNVIPCFLKVQRAYKSALSMNEGDIKQVEYYNFIWILHADQQLTEETLGIDNYPYSIIAEFPNGQKRYYSF